MCNDKAFCMLFKGHYLHISADTTVGLLTVSAFYEMRGRQKSIELNRELVLQKYILVFSCMYFTMEDHGNTKCGYLLN